MPALPARQAIPGGDGGPGFRFHTQGFPASPIRFAKAKVR